MKTNVIVKSDQDRKLFDIVIRQETKTGFLNLSDLAEAYTRARVLNGWANRGEPHQVLGNKENIERIYYLLRERSLIKEEILTFIEKVEKDGIIKTLKEANVYRTTGRGQNKATYCDPYIWVLVAMELNPQLYAKVVTWLTDNLILNRIEAGNMYKGLSSALATFENPDYRGIAKMLNCIVFGRHENGMRNSGSIKELKELEDLEKLCANLINMGFVKTQDQLKNELMKIYDKKWKVRELCWN